MGLSEIYWLFSLVSTMSASSLLSKTINADGSKEFRIAKQIKHNTCLCQCRCVPENMDLFPRRPVNEPSSPETVEVGDNAVKEENRLKASMVQELTAFTTRSVESTTASNTRSFAGTHSKILVPPEVVKADDSLSDVVQNFSTSTETVTSYSTSALSSNTSSSEVPAITSTLQTTTTSFVSEASAASTPDFHKVTASNMVKFTSAAVKIANHSTLAKSSSPEVMNSIDAAVPPSKDGIKPPIIQPAFPNSLTTSATKRTTVGGVEEDFIAVKHGDTKLTTETISTEKSPTVEMMPSSSDFVSSTNVMSQNTVKNTSKPRISSDGSLEEEKQTITTTVALTKVLSSKDDATMSPLSATTQEIFTAETLDDHMETFSSSPEINTTHVDFEKKSQAHSTALMKSSTTWDNDLGAIELTTAATMQSSPETATHLISASPSPSTIQATTKEVTEESNSQATAHESISISSTSLVVPITTNTIVESSPISIFLTTTQSTTRKTAESTTVSTKQPVIEASPALTYLLENSLMTNESIQLTSLSKNAEDEHQRTSILLVKDSVKSTQQSASSQPNPNSGTITVTSTLATSTAPSSILVKKFEVLPSHRGLPERWKALVLRLKKKLEALKAQKSLFSVTSNDSPTIKSFSISNDGNTTTDNSLRLSSKKLTEPTFSARRQLSADKNSADEMVESSSTTTAKATVLSSTPKMATEQESSTARIFSTISETVEDDVTTAQNEGPIPIVTSSAMEITSSASNSFSSEDDLVRKTISLSDIITSTAVNTESTIPGWSSENTKSTDSKITEVALLDNSALDMSFRSKMSSTQQNIVDEAEQARFLEETLTTEASPTSETARTTHESILSFAPKVSTESTVDFKKSLDSPTITEFIKPSPSLQNVTTTRIPASTTRNETKDGVSVGGFVVSNRDSSSEEVEDPNVRREPQHEASGPRRDSFSKNNSVPFMIGQSVEKINILSSIINDIIRGVPLMTTTTRSSTTVVVRSDVVAENGNLEKRIREERIRYEQAKQSREEQLRHETIRKESESDRTLREELLRRSEELQRRMERLKAEEITRLHLLEQQQRKEEERFRKIAIENEQRKFAEFTSTALPPQYQMVTKRFRYRLRPAQCVAINKFTRVFNITDPSLWIAENCQIAKRYFPQASCPQIQALIESCFVFV